MTGLISDFRRWAREHRNFMTPDILKLYQRGNIIIELSEGSGFEHNPIYGVTVREYAEGEGFKDTPRAQELQKAGGCFDSLAEAKAAIDIIKRVVKNG